MPKMKSKRSAAKKFSLTGTGKVKYKKMNLRHILTKKTTKRTRSLRGPAYVDKTQEKTIRQMLPY